MVANDFVIDNFGVLKKYVGNGGNVYVPSSVKAIGTRAFYGSAVSSVFIPGSVSEVCDEAFLDCERLSRISIAEGCVRIGRRAFLSDSPLARIYSLPSTLREIGDNAFFSKKWENVFEPDLTAPHCSVFSVENAVTVRHFIPYGCASINILPTDEYKKANFPVWTAKKEKELEDAMREAIKRRDYARATLDGLHREIESAEQKLKELKGIFKRGERVKAEARVSLTQRKLPSAEKELRIALERIEALKKRQAAFRAKDITAMRSEFEEECAARLTKKARGEIFSCREAIKAEMQRKIRAEAAKARQTNITAGGGDLAATASTEYGASVWTGIPDHGPLATATNCGMPIHESNGETFPIYDTDTLGAIDITDM